MSDQEPDWMARARAEGWAPQDLAGTPADTPPEPEDDTSSAEPSEHEAPEMPRQDTADTWEQQATAAGWTPKSTPAPEPAWMQEARQAGWNPTAEGAAYDGVPGRSPEWGQTGQWQPVAPQPVSAPPPAAPEPKRSNRVVIIAAGTLVCLLVAGAGAAILMAVASSDEDARLVPPPTLARTSTAPTATVTTVIVQSSKKSRRRKNENGRDGTSTGSASSPSGAGQQRSSTASPTARLAVEQALNRHFSQLVDGEYSTAYNNLTGAVATGASSWISAQREDNLQSFELDVSPEVSGDTAVANIVRFVTYAEASGCHTWSGSWGMAKVDGSWKIAKSNLTRGSC